MPVRYRTGSGGIGAAWPRGADLGVASADLVVLNAELGVLSADLGVLSADLGVLNGGLAGRGGDSGPAQQGSRSLPAGRLREDRER
ncbi:hypothetical protein ABZ639_29235 [Saccharomonospora sp. NPDC006951]